MTRHTVIALVFALLAAVTAARGDDALDRLVAELSGAAPAPVRAETELRAAYARVLTALIPGMAAETLPDRAKPQTAVERIALHASRPGAEPERAALSAEMAARVAADVPNAARLWLLRQLERIGSAEAVPALAKLLADPDPALRDAARRALVGNPSPAAVAALRDACVNAVDEAGRVAALHSLAARLDWQLPIPQDSEQMRTMGMLKALDASNGSSVVEREALWVAWGALGDAKCLLEPTRRYADRGPGSQADPDPRIRNAAARAVLRILERAWRSDDPLRAANLYWDVWEAPLDRTVRVAGLLGFTRAAAQLQGATRDRALRRVVESLRDPDPCIRLALIPELESLPDAPITTALLDRLAVAPPAEQVVIVAVLGARGDAAARPAVLALLAADADAVRTASARALVTLGDRDTAVTLARTAGAAGGAVRDAVGWALGRLNAEGVDAALRAALASEPPPVRAEALRALAARRCRDAVPDCLAQTNDADVAVQIAACEALRALAPFERADELVAVLLAADDAAVVAAALDAVVAACNRAPDAAARAVPLLAAWDRGSVAHRVRLAPGLARVGGAAALDRLCTARRTDAADLVDAAVRALAAWPDALALDELRDLAERADKPTHRILALRGYVRLLELPSARPPAETVQLLRGALRLAARPEERTLVLGAVGKVSDAAALAFARECLADAELRPVAETTVVSVAQLIGLLEPEAARAALEEIRRSTAGDATRQRAEEVLGRLRQTQGRVVRWLGSGPYFESGREWAWVFDHPFAPEEGDGRDATWQVLRPTNPQAPWVFDLDAFNGPARCFYVRCAVRSPRAQPAQLQVGSDDGVRVWLNGVLVHEARLTRAHNVLGDKVAVELRAGWNVLLLKIVQVGGAWQFSAAVRAPDGGPLDGLELALEPTE